MSSNESIELTLRLALQYWRVRLVDVQSLVRKFCAYLSLAVGTAIFITIAVKHPAAQPSHVHLQEFFTLNTTLLRYLPLQTGFNGFIRSNQFLRSSNQTTRHFLRYLQKNLDGNSFNFWRQLFTSNKLSFLNSFQLVVEKIGKKLSFLTCRKN